MPPAPDQVDEARALVRLGIDEIRQASGGIGAIDRAIAERVFSAVGSQAAWVRRVHRAVSRSAYAGVGGATSLTGRLAADLVGRRGTDFGRELSPTRLGGSLIGVIDGLIGNELEGTGSELQHPMAVRVDGRVVDRAPETVASAFPDATKRIAVFVHGLMGTEFPWEWFKRENGGTYGTRLADDLGYTPVYVRYNTGRHISENGRALTEVLQRLCASWPTELEEVALIGHSMGGLVARSACYYGTEEKAEWPRLVRRVVTLGTPHLGAPLAQAVHHASAGLDRLPDSHLGLPLRRGDRPPVLTDPVRADARGPEGRGPVNGVLREERHCRIHVGPLPGAPVGLKPFPPGHRLSLRRLSS